MSVKSILLIDDEKHLSTVIQACLEKPSLVGKGARGLGFTLAFPHDVKSQVHQRGVREHPNFFNIPRLGLNP
jgi:hypothetical protein